MTSTVHRPLSWPWLLLLEIPAIALRGRVVLLAAVGVCAVWAVDATWNVSQRAMPVPPEQWSELGTVAASSLLAVWLAFVEPFVAIAGGESIGPNLVRIIARVIVWALVGGAIVRIAALSLTRDESPSIPGAVRYAWRNTSGFLGGPLLLLAGLGVVWLPLALVRLAMQAAVLEPIAAVLWPFVILAAFVAMVYTLGAAVGWPLVLAAAATDDSDAFDAVSRMFSYVYQKPLRLVGYLVAIAALGLVMAVGTHAFATSVHHACLFAAGENNVAWAASAISWWTSAAYRLVTAILTAYLWSAASGLYVLRRLDVDGVHVDEVHIAPEEFAGGLPHLGEDSNGMPLVEKPASDAA